MDNTKMPERVFASKALMNEGTDDEYGYFYPIVKHDNVTEYIRADLVPQWIKCSERVPEESSITRRSEVVLVWIQTKDRGFVAFGQRYYGRWNNVDSMSSMNLEDHYRTVTHWQPLPANPSEDV